MAPSSDEISAQISGILEETLFPDDPITPGSTLLGDLGAESIDFLDIMHQMEKAFDLTLSRDDFWPDDILTSEEYVEDGRVNEAGVAALKNRMPYADLSAFEEEPSLKSFGDLLTVGDLCKMVEHKLAEGGEAAADDGGEAAADDGGEAAVDDGGEAAVDDSGEAAVDDGGEVAADDGGEAAADDGGEVAADDGGEADPLS